MGSEMCIRDSPRSLILYLVYIQRTWGLRWRIHHLRFCRKESLRSLILYLAYIQQPSPLRLLLKLPLLLLRHCTHAPVLSRDGTPSHTHAHTGRVVGRRPCGPGAVGGVARGGRPEPDVPSGGPELIAPLGPTRSVVVAHISVVVARRSVVVANRSVVVAKRRRAQEPAANSSLPHSRFGDCQIYPQVTPWNVVRSRKRPSK